MISRINRNSISSPKIIVLVFLIIGAIFNGCSEGGGVTSPEEPETGEPREITSSFESEDTSFLPGEIQFIVVEDYTLQVDEYEATIVNGSELVLYRYSEDEENKTLVFIVPEEAAEDHEIQFTLDDQEQSLSFTIEEYEVIENAEEFVLSSKNIIYQQLENAVNQTQNEETKQILQSALAELDKALEDFQTLENFEQKLIAYILKENLGTNTTKMNQSKTIDQCSDLSTKLSESPKRVAKVATLGVSGGFLGGIKGTIVNVFTTSSIFDELSNTIDYLELFIDNCIVPELKMEAKSKIQNSNGFEFTHNESQLFNVNLTKSLDEEIEAIIAETKESLGDLLSILPSSWFNYLFENDFIDEEVANTALFSVLEISDPDIKATYTSLDSEADFSFSFNEDSIPVESRSFNFNYGNEETSLNIEATLNPPVPVAYNLDFSTPTNETLIDTLKADYAANFSIENKPINGTVKLINAELGIFEYTSNQDYEGTDSFTFSASNANGNSESANVDIAIENLLDKFKSAVLGKWLVYGVEDGVESGSPRNLVL